MSKSFHKRAFLAYQKVKSLKPARSLFDLSHEKLLTGDMGKLYPICAMEMSPGDTFHIWNEIVTRMQPLNAPILHSIKLYTHYFFVPYRILWEEWTNFITGGVEGEFGGNNRGDVATDIDPELPRWSPTNTAVGSLWDYLGFPVGVVPDGALPLDFIRRCYNRIWNEYYRDETLQDEVSEDNETILHRNWKKDYFTSALISQQRGISPAMPLNGFALSGSQSFTVESTRTEGQKLYFKTTIPITSSTISNFNSTSVTGTGRIGTSTPITFTGTFGSTFKYSTGSVTPTGTCSQPVFVDTNSFYITISDNIPISEVNDVSISGSKSITVTDLSGVSGSDVKDLRVAFQIQRWLELANRGGVRYTEFLRSFFGVSPRDDRLQRPEYIGGSKSPIVISEVLQTSSTDSEPTPQGNMAGHGIGADRTYIGSYTATEFGIVMGLLSVMPEAKYQQGINRQWLRRTKFDFLFPQFTGLSEQAIEEAEIYATDTESENRRVFGFNEVYDELRSMPSQICGKMRTVFDYWHLGRKFDSAPALNSDFITCNPSKRIFAVTDEDGFIFDVGNIIRAVRPIPKYGTPRGV